MQLRFQIYCVRDGDSFSSSESLNILSWYFLILNPGQKVLRLALGSLMHVSNPFGLRRVLTNSSSLGVSGIRCNTFILCSRLNFSNVLNLNVLNLISLKALGHGVSFCYTFEVLTTQISGICLTCCNIFSMHLCIAKITM